MPGLLSKTGSIAHRKQSSVTTVDHHHEFRGSPTEAARRWRAHEEIEEEDENEKTNNPNEQQHRVVSAAAFVNPPVSVPGNRSVGGRFEEGKGGQLPVSGEKRNRTPDPWERSPAPFNFARGEMFGGP